MYGADRFARRAGLSTTTEDRQTSIRSTIVWKRYDLGDGRALSQVKVDLGQDLGPPALGHYGYDDLPVSMTVGEVINGELAHEVIGVTLSSCRAEIPRGHRKEGGFRVVA